MNTSNEGASSSPGRDQLIDAAMRSIATHGLRGATVRKIADDAGVTPGLVVHHFGTKDNLAAQVDALVVARFRSAMTADAPGHSPDDAAETIADALSQIIGSDAILRSYVRRSFLEASPAGQVLFDQLVELTLTALRRNIDPGRLPTGRALQWLAVQVVTVNLAGTLLEPLLGQLLDDELFSPAEVKHRTADNLDFITAALGRYVNDDTA